MMDIMLSLNSSNTHGYHLTHDETLLIKKAMIKTKIEREGKWVRGEREIRRRVAYGEENLVLRKRNRKWLRTSNYMIMNNIWWSESFLQPILSHIWRYCCSRWYEISTFSSIFAWLGIRTYNVCFMYVGINGIIVLQLPSAYFYFLFENSNIRIANSHFLRNRAIE